MNHTKAILLAACCLFLTGCTTVQRGENFQIKVSGTPGAKFSCKYEFANSSGAISTAVTGQADRTILDLPAANGYCDITNETPGTVLKATVFEGKRERFSFRTSTNTPAFRLIRDSAGWRSEVRK
jgi:hypothetical protein